jgi:hypothetical protein
MRALRCALGCAHARLLHVHGVNQDVREMMR